MYLLNASWPGVVQRSVRGRRNATDPSWYHSSTAGLHTLFACFQLVLLASCICVSIFSYRLLHPYLFSFLCPQLSDTVPTHPTFSQNSSSTLSICSTQYCLRQRQEQYQMMHYNVSGSEKQLKTRYASCCLKFFELKHTWRLWVTGFFKWPRVFPKSCW
jgi:hypothetical protein